MNFPGSGRSPVPAPAPRCGLGKSPLPQETRGVQRPHGRPAFAKDLPFCPIPSRLFPVSGLWSIMFITENRGTGNVNQLRFAGICKKECKEATVQSKRRRELYS